MKGLNIGLKFLTLKTLYLKKVSEKILGNYNRTKFRLSHNHGESRCVVLKIWPN